MDFTQGTCRRLLTAAACGAAFAFSAEAQATNPPPSENSTPDRTKQPAELATVKVVADQSQDDGLHSTTAKSVVDRASIASYGDSSLGDALQRVPGISVDEVGGRRVVRMRGLGGGYTQILIDGQPVPANFSIDSLSVALIERIEIIRVPTADLSARAIAGTVNIVLSKPGPKLQRSITASGSRDGGSDGLDASMRLAGKRGESPYSLALSAGRAHFDRPGEMTETGYDSGGARNLLRVTQRVNGYAVDSFGLAANIKRQINSNASLAFELLATGRDAAGHNYERTETFEGLLPEYSNSIIFYTSDNSDLRSKLQWVHQFAGTAKLETDFSATQSRRLSGVAFRGFDVAQVLVRDRQVQSDASDRTFALNAKYLFPLRERHSIDLGIQTEWISRNERRVQVDVTPTGLAPVDLNESYDADVWRFAVYAQDEWAVRDNVSAYLGLRWEGVRTATRGSEIQRINNSIGVWSPVLQAVWRISEARKEQMRLGVSRTFKPPQPVELVPRRFISNNNTPTSPDTRGNPGLRAEVATGLDVAYERALPGGLLSVSSYARRIDGVIVSQLLFEDERWISVPFNVGTANVYGIESELRFNLAKMWPAAPGLNVRFSLQKNWSNVSHVEGPDNTLDRQVPLVASAGGDYRVNTFKTVVGVDYKFEGSRASRTSEPVLTTGNVRRGLDVYAASELTDRVKLRVALTNLLGETRHTGVTYSNPQGLLVQDTAAPTDTMVRATIEVKL